MEEEEEEEAPYLDEDELLGLVVRGDELLAEAEHHVAARGVAPLLVGLQLWARERERERDRMRTPDCGFTADWYTQTHTHTDTHLLTHTHTHTHTHTQTHTHRDKHTQTQTHRQTQTNTQDFFHRF